MHVLYYYYQVFIKQSTCTKDLWKQLVLALGKVWKKCFFFQLLYTSIIRNKNRAFCWNNRRVILIMKQNCFKPKIDPRYSRILCTSYIKTTHTDGIFFYQVNNGSVFHMETRESSTTTTTETNSDSGTTSVRKLDVLLRVDIKHAALIHFLKTLRRSSFLSDVHLVSSKSINLKCDYMNFSLHTLF